MSYPKSEKIFHLKSKLPRFVAILMPDSMTDVIEYSWNAFPRYRTELHNAFFGEKVFLCVETMHANDRGTTKNAIGMDAGRLSCRKVETLDIACESKEVPMESVAENPTLFKSSKTGRGPLSKNFATSCVPVMTCYKVVTVQFKIFPVQSRVESWALSYSRNTFIKYHRKLFCWMDEWFGLTIDDIRKIENDTVKITKTKIQASLQQSSRTWIFKPTLISPGYLSSNHAPHFFLYKNQNFILFVHTVRSSAYSAIPKVIFLIIFDELRRIVFVKMINFDSLPIYTLCSFFPTKWKFVACVANCLWLSYTIPFVFFFPNTTSLQQTPVLYSFTPPSWCCKENCCNVWYCTTISSFFWFSSRFNLCQFICHTKTHFVNARLGIKKFAYAKYGAMNSSRIDSKRYAP